MTDLLEPLVDRIEALQKRIDGMVTLRWGTVTQESPLRIRLDADEDPLPFAPATTVPRLLVGERVLCAVQHRRVIMVSVAGRGQATQAQVDAGADASRYVTPATLRNAEHLPFAMAAGSVTAGVSWVTVTLPAGRFTVEPRVNAQMISGAGENIGAAAMVANVSASSFILRKGGPGSEVRHDWIAVQMTEGSAVG